jgi:hypothetical protein
LEGGVMQTQELITDINCSIDRLEKLCTDNPDIRIVKDFKGLSIEQIHEVFKKYVEDNGYWSSYKKPDVHMSAHDGMAFYTFSIYGDSDYSMSFTTIDYKLNLIGV